MEDINTAQPLAGGVNVAPTDGASAESEEVVSFKDLLSKTLGKEFKDDESALKAVKDTFSYVGEYGKVRPAIQKLQEKYGKDFITKMDEITNQPAQAAPDTSNYVTKEELAADRFFSKNPDYDANRIIIDSVAKSTGKTLEEVVALPEIKSLFEKAKAYEAVENTKSVLQTNSRLGVAADNVTKSREALASGNRNAAIDAAMNAVAEAYDFK